MCLMWSVALWIYWFSIWGYSKYWPKTAVFIYILLVLCQSLLLLAINQDLLHNVFLESCAYSYFEKVRALFATFISLYIFLDGCSAYCLQVWFYIIVILKLHDHGIFQIKGWRQHSDTWIYSSCLWSSFGQWFNHSSICQHKGVQEISELKQPNIKKVNLHLLFYFNKIM
jgi:hypothetical protein